MPEFVWSAPISTSLREKLLSGPYTSPKMAHLYAVALDVNGEVWAQWQAGCAWVVDSEAAKVTANAVFVELAAAQAELTAARRGPVVEWRPRIDVEEATPGDFGLVVGEGGWTLEFFDKHGDAMQVDSGPQTGLEGKAAAGAAYRKAAGL